MAFAKISILTLFLSFILYETALSGHIDKNTYNAHKYLGKWYIHGVITFAGPSELRCMKAYISAVRDSDLFTMTTYYKSPESGDTVPGSVVQFHDDDPNNYHKNVGFGKYLEHFSDDEMVMQRTDWPYKYIIASRSSNDVSESLHEEYSNIARRNNWTYNRINQDRC